MKYDFEKYRNKVSTRHHYIPRYLIDGFCNSEGLVFIYDKEEDKIKKNPRPPKSIFFENDRNNIVLPDNTESSILEETLYRDIDNVGSEIVKYFQNTELDKIAITDDNYAQFLYFLVTLFWRIPKTDDAVRELVKEAKIEIKGIDAEVLRSDEAFVKSQRAKIISHTLKEMMSDSKPISKMINIHKIPDDLLVIGDNPLLFKNENYEFKNFGREDFLIALTSNRLFVSSKNKEIILNNFNGIAYNNAVINQSVRFVCSGNLDFLTKTVKTYRETIKRGLNLNLTEIPFMNQ